MQFYLSSGEASGNPPPQIHWLKNSQRIIQANDQIYDSLDQDSVLGLSLTRGRLVINCADVEDTATYTCVAENAYSRVVAQSQVNVLALEKTGDTAHLSVTEQQACIEKKSFGSMFFFILFCFLNFAFKMLKCVQILAIAGRHFF